ncbi:hypothetical protein C6496_21985 [Candidatus Poribacteria bacterium]|nr:MAG: hypothetical protein C6496_21985 [Candidatus Poribacteria bacterium]
MKMFFTLLACFLSLLFVFGCGETDDPFIAPGSPGESIGARSAREPLLPPESYPDWWVRLTDGDVSELLKMEVPKVWSVDIPQEQLDTYLHAQWLQKFGDIQEVRLVIESRINLRRAGRAQLPNEMTIALLRATYVLWPTKDNKRQLEDALRNLQPDDERNEKLDGDDK